MDINIIKKICTFAEPPLALKQQNIDSINKNLFKSEYYDCTEITASSLTSMKTKAPRQIVSRDAEFSIKEKKKDAFNYISDDCTPDIEVEYSMDVVDKYLSLLVCCHESNETSEEEEDIDKMIQNMLDEINRRSLFINKIYSARMNFNESLSRNPFSQEDLDILSACNKNILDCFSQVKLSDGSSINI
uniref:Uncharacterized protein n=1 Tax=viral metagenome TaxID=1070528 RepID=A0A6C0B2B5_9ZZZZ